MDRPVFSTDADRCHELDNITKSRGWRYIAGKIQDRVDELRKQATIHPVNENNLDSVNNKIIEANAYEKILHFAVKCVEGKETL